MSDEIEIFYFLKHVPNLSFILSINKDSTVKDVLDKLNENFEENYTTLFYLGSKMDSTDLIIDYIEDDPKYIFTASKRFFKPITARIPGPGPVPKVPRKDSLNPSHPQRQKIELKLHRTRPGKAKEISRARPSINRPTQQTSKNLEPDSIKQTAP
ncbi:hypothetical protein M9Y10_031619 [Tritrichomonas musculus]|uniref:Ubiquitin-like domain-containing protein n=1 Tax=Tritrichomonas musculus TaxID=1915356 RepID=A0ABR2H132_9EUKA